MGLNDRIEKIKPYFKIFNVCDGISYVLVRFPKNWTLFDTDELCTNYNIQLKQNNDGVYFFCETIDEIDNVFDAIEYIIENNKSLEEKKELLQIKAKELRDIFASETLEKLKTLEFTFGKKSSVKTKKNDIKNDTTVKEDTTDALTTTVISEPQDSHVEENGNTDCLVTNNSVIKEEKSKKNKKHDKSDGLLGFVEDLCENGE